jgi:hypothetical protein
MADEITAHVSLQLYTTNNLTQRFEPPGRKFTQTNVEVYENTISLTTTDTKLSFTNTTNYGWGFFHNVSSSTAAVVNIGVDSTAVIRPFATLGYQKWGVFPLVPTSTYRAQMSTTSGGLLKYGHWGS